MSSNPGPTAPQTRRASLRKRILLILCLFKLVCAVALVFAAANRARLIAPAPTLLLLDRQGEFLAETRTPVRGGGRLCPPHEVPEYGAGYWPVDSLPARVVAATIALEDHRFWEHHGVDGIALVRAATQNLKARERISGASTIAMQVARMQSPGERTYSRKLIETLTALLLTRRYGRETILAHYLRIVPYGNRIHGIAYAARRYFNKPVEDLSWAEIAVLAAIPQAPAKMNPYESSGMARAIQRGQRILAALRVQGVMSKEEFALALEQIHRLRMPSRGRRPDYAMHAVLHMVRKLNLEGGPPCPPRSTVLQTTLDLELQREVSWMTWEALQKWEKYGAGNAAVIVLDHRTNEVLAWVGSADYFDSEHAGAIDYTQIARSSGSTLKPFLFALALEKGVIAPSTILEDVNRAEGGITNADESYMGPLLPRVALANSRNVPAVDLLIKTGIEPTYSFLGDVGLHQNNEPARKYGVGLAVGNLSVTLEQLVKAYSTIAGEGRMRDLVWFRDQKTESRHVLSGDTARQITLFLSDPMARLPSFPRMGATEYPFPVAVKTGTSYAHRDAWTVAYSHRYLVGVWVGHPDFRPMNRLSGYRSAATLAQRILLHLHERQKDGLQTIPFSAPRGWSAIRLCAFTGKIATPQCERVSLEWFQKGHEPYQICDAHIRVAIDTRTNAPASWRTPESLVRIKTFLQLPPQFSVWAASEQRSKMPSIRTTDEEATVQIASPENGTRIMQDPETPPDAATISLLAVVRPQVQQLVWYVDGMPFQTVDYPYTTRWPLRSGTHTFYVEVPFTTTRSSPVSIHVD